MSSPGVAEKGKFDVRLEISAPGGHSSIPPDHTVSPLTLYQVSKYILTVL